MTKRARPENASPATNRQTAHSKYSAVSIEEVYNLIMHRASQYIEAAEIAKRPTPFVNATMFDGYQLVVSNGPISTTVVSQANQRWYLYVRNEQNMPYTQTSLTPKNSNRAEIDPRTAPDLIETYHKNIAERVP